MTLLHFQIRSTIDQGHRRHCISRVDSVHRSTRRPARILATIEQCQQHYIQHHCRPNIVNGLVFVPTAASSWDTISLRHIPSLLLASDCLPCWRLLLELE